MQTGNPALSQNTFLDVASGRLSGSEAMSLNGTVNKTAILLALVLITAVYAWGQYTGPESVGSLYPLVIGGAIGGFIVALVTIFKQTWAPVTAPIYALLEGLFVGGLSVIFEAQFPGIVMQAVMATMATFAAMLFAYRTGIIRVTDTFRRVITAAVGGIMLLYLVNIVMSFFGASIGFIHEGGMLGIGFSLVVVVVAALSLALNFDVIEKGVEAGAPKYMEWYGAFGLIVTLVWLYIEMLRLLSKLQSSD